MLTWNECEELAKLPADEAAALDQTPSDDLLEFMLDGYIMENSLGIHPGIKSTIVDDIENARKIGYLQMAALLRSAVQYRIDHRVVKDISHSDLDFNDLNTQN